jgi:hypothetical protein
MRILKTAIDGSPFVSVSETRDVMRVLETCRQSAAEETP